MVHDDLEAGRLVRLLPEYRPVEISMNAVYPHRHHLSAKVRTFIDMLVRHSCRAAEADQSVFVMRSYGFAPFAHAGINLVRMSRNAALLLAVLTSALARVCCASGDGHVRPAARCEIVGGKARADRGFHQWRNRRAANSRRHRAGAAARQAGLSEMVRHARSRQRDADDGGCDLPDPFRHQDRHQRGGDDADRPRQDRARRSRQQVHPVICGQKVGVERKDDGGKIVLDMVPRAVP